ncbi:hypothetical protein J8F10_05245 [Gemmata sp. G18]|uniref:PDZ domain-containing protein n=1 Tax=Gemmata palustris TaxID=2822762 RepID=A0ABS5BPA7_9BACT|nr:DUF6624 domain-containing protein [Gemmata palustris]MBP3954688.1 hypothetical protein [Gemmata palustris]
MRQIVVSAVLIFATVLQAAPLDAAKEPALREELLARVKTDQDARTKLIEAGSPPPKELIEALKKVDDTNRAWLKGVVEKHGWPGKALVGTDGAHAAWLLVQHSDADLPFQKKCLGLLETAVKAGEATGTDLAYLTDRVLAAEGKKQRYGTQLEQKDGKLVPKPVEDQEKLDVRRKELGLMPMAEYVAFAERMYKLKPAIPIRKPEFEAVVSKVLPAKEGEKDVLATVFVKGRDAGIPVTKTTAIHKQMGKLVPAAELSDIKDGVKVSVWITNGKAEAVLIFP